MSPTQYAYHFGDSPDWRAGNTATQEGIHSLSMDKVSKEIALLRADSRAWTSGATPSLGPREVQL